MTEKTRILLGVTALIVTLVLTTPCLAEEVDTEYLLDTVKVSAQKREENVQDVPMSVDVLSGMDLEDSRITGLLDMGNITPNLYLSSTGGTGTMNFLGIRGRMNTGADLSPAVSVFVDGVPYDDFYSVANNLLYDIERVEVLRGPQSAMYGLNSIAGVVNIITRQPTDELRIKLFGEGGYGDKWDGTSLVGGSISGPLVDGKLSGGLAFMDKGQGGYIFNEYSDSRYNSDNTVGVKGDFKWTPADAWTISGGMAYTKLHGQSGNISVPYEKTDAAAIGQRYKKWTVDNDWEGGSDLETWAPHLKVNYLHDIMELSSMTTFRASNQEFEYDADLGSAPSPASFLAHINGGFKTFSQEFRVQSNTNEQDAFQWMAGYFYHRFNRNQVFGMAPTTAPSSVMSFVDAEINGSSHALFGQGTYRLLNKKIGLTLGLRQEWTQQSAEEQKGYFGEESATDSQFLPKLAVDYRITPEHMVYASISRGWRSGGINYLTNVPGQFKFKKETCWAYEIGTKTRWLQDKVQFNAAAFYNDYTDFQDRYRTGPMTEYLSNAPKVKMAGVEAELEARPIQPLFLTAAFGYTNAWYVDFPDVTAGNFDGKQVILMPDFNAVVAAKYTFLENFYVRPEAQGVGTIYWDRSNNRKQAPYAVLNLRAGYVGENYDIYVFGENLTNEYSFKYAFDFNSNGKLYGDPITPFRAGVGARVEF